MSLASSTLPLIKSSLNNTGNLLTENKYEFIQNKIKNKNKLTNFLKKKKFN